MKRPGGQMVDSAMQSLSEDFAFPCAPKLTPAQHRVLRLALRGYSIKHIALELRCAQGTVSAHLTRVFQVLGVANRYELLVKCDVATPVAIMVRHLPCRSAESTDT